MNSVAGVFTSHSAASAATALLVPVVSADRVNLLRPGDPREEIHKTVPSSGDMAPVGETMAGTLGGALGLGLGVVVFLPVVGPVTVLAMIAAALAGIGGAVLGGAAGKAADRTPPDGLPIEELFIYEDALRKGRSVVIVQAETEAQERTVREILTTSGAESIDAAREEWWADIRGAQAAEYSDKKYGVFAEDESVYRQGFAAALRPGMRGHPYSETQAALRARYPAIYATPAFRRGYDNGLAYHAELLAKRSA